MRKFFTTLAGETLQIEFLNGQMEQEFHLALAAGESDLGRWGKRFKVLFILDNDYKFR